MSRLKTGSLIHSPGEGGEGLKQSQTQSGPARQVLMSTGCETVAKRPLRCNMARLFLVDSLSVFPTAAHDLRAMGLPPLELSRADYGAYLRGASHQTATVGLCSFHDLDRGGRSLLLHFAIAGALCDGCLPRLFRICRVDKHEAAPRSCTAPSLVRTAGTADSALRGTFHDRDGVKTVQE